LVIIDRMELPMARAFSQSFGLTTFALVAGLAASIATARAEETINLTLDRATVIRAPAKTTTVIIGNPAIADVSIQKNGVMVLTAKSYGETNLLALDSEGKLVSESWLKVQASSRNNLVVHRGGETETYSCEPLCRPTVTLGDSEKHFGKTSSQSGARNSLATPAGK
jgi:Pilus formation protein N terminal region